MEFCENSSTITTNSPTSEIWDRFPDDIDNDLYFFPHCSLSKIENEFYYDTEVIVIGNGPAGIALSAFISGIQPYYDGTPKHSNTLFHQKLLDGKDEVNLLYKDIDWFEKEFQYLIKPGSTAEASFYDVLNKSYDEDNNENYLKVRINQDEYIPHLVIGSGEIGGSWNTYDDEMISLSFGSGMDLPGYSMKEFLNCPHLNVRLPARIVKEYFKNYVLKMELDKNFISNTKVLRVEKLCDIRSEKEFWSVTCLKKGELLPYTLTCKKIVLGIGKNVIQKLDLKGVYNEDKIIYELRDLKNKIKYLRKESGWNADNFFNSNELFHYFLCTKKYNKIIKVIVIGDGYGAADVVSYCLSKGIHIIHVIKRDKLQMKNHKLSSISDSIYPEYSSIYRLMMGRINNPNYVKYLGASISQIYDDDVVIDTPKGKINENYTFIVPCIGKKVDDTLKVKNFNISQTYRSHYDSTIFGIGSLIGDHYVRECVGGAMAVARMIINTD
uniref:FAD/NAD(P)-binding domain-containing protein n=1 Tax=Strongyloides stercoralis TaxID=6248 RepID=A0A0K0E9I5_STRER